MKKSILALACVAFVAFAAGCKGCDSCKGAQTPVTVPFSFTLNRESINLEAGTGIQISAAISGSNEKPVWSSSDERVATVSDTGFVYGVSSGTATITATVNGVSQSCTVIVTGISYMPVLTLSHEKVGVFVGGTVSASGYVTFNFEMLEDVQLTWSSSNASVATVENGVIRGVAEGNATIIVRAEYNQTLLEKTIEVQVKKAEAFFINESGVRLSVTAINANDRTTTRLSTTAQSLSGNATEPLNGEVEWSSSDTSIVSVDEYGELTSHKKGTATVTASLKVAGEVKYTAWTEIEVYKSVVSGVTALGENGEIDLSQGDFTFSVSELTGATLDYEIEQDEVLVTQDKWTYGIVSVSNGEITIANESISWGERTFTVELKDRIVTGKTLAITKVLRTAQDIQNITQLAGGRDTKSQAYAGYFVLGNSIDLNTAKIGAELDAPLVVDGVEKADQNMVITRGFQGVFDGRGYALIGGQYTTGGGLFGTVGNAGTIKNVALINASLASVESVGAGLFAQKFYGTMEDVSVSCILKGNYVNNATIAAWVSGATFKNVVAETVYEGTRGEDSSNYGFLLQVQGSDTVLNNVYVITDLMDGTSVKAIARGTYQEIGHGFNKYSFNDVSQYHFSGFDTNGVWADYASNEIPVFQTEKAAGYTTYRVEHHREYVSPQYNDAGEIVSVVSRYNLNSNKDVARYHAIAGTAVTATAKVIDGYKANDRLAGTKLNGVAGELTDEDCLKVVYSLTKSVSFNGAQEVAYTVQYHFENETTGNYIINDSLTQTYTVTEGTYCQATIDTLPKGYYADTSVIGSNESGIITRSQKTLNVYAKVAVPVANTEDKGYIYPLANDADCGSRDFETTFVGTYAGQANAYKLEFASKLRFRIVGVDNVYAESNGYTKFTFKLYMENPATTNYAIYLYDKDTKAVKSSFSLHLASQLKAQYGYVRLIDSNGDYVSSAPANEWFTVEVNIDNIQSRAQGLKRIHVEMQCNEDSTVYMSDVQLSKGDWTQDRTYSVEYYFENENGEYVLNTQESVQGLQAKEGEYVTAEIKSFANYAYDGAQSISAGFVKGDNYKLKLYYSSNIISFGNRKVANLGVLTNTGVLGSSEIAIDKIPSMDGETNVTSITWNTSADTRRVYPVRVLGVDKEWINDNGVHSIRMQVRVPENSGFTVFVYNGNDVKTYQAATVTSERDVLQAQGWLAVLDEDGNLLNSVPTQQWVTLLVNLDNVGELVTNGISNLNFALYAEPTKTVYLADVEFSTFAFEETSYNVEYYKWNDMQNGYVLDESLTQTKQATLYTHVSAEYEPLAGYIPASNSNLSVLSGIVYPNEQLTLKLYYDSEDKLDLVQIANTENKGYLYPLSGDASFGASGLTIEKQSQAVAGVDNAYKLTSTEKTAVRIVGVDNAYATQNGYKTFKFDIYLDSYGESTNRPFIKLVDASGTYQSNIAYLTKQGYMKNAENYARIYNADGVRMSQVTIGQWCTVEVDIANVGSRNAGYPRMHVELYTETDSSYSYYVANATLSTDSFGKTDSPIAVTYNGETVGAMVSYQGTGFSGIISSTQGMRLTQTTKADKSCVEVKMLASSKTTAGWLQLQGLSSSDITEKGITKITFDYYIENTNGNPLMRMFDTTSARSFFISPWRETSSLVKVNTANGKVASGEWCTVEITLKNDSMTVGDWAGSAWSGLNIQLGAESGSFYIANVTLS